MALIYPSIPDPTNTSDSLVTSVRALKQAVEQLTGQRNVGPAAHIFSQSATPTAIAVGDLWVDPSNGSVLRHWDGKNWIGTGTGGAPTITVAATAPTSPNVGDIWVDTATSDILSVWTGTVWQLVAATPYPPATTGPIFEAYKSAADQSISANTWTQLVLDAETFDTNDNFASDEFTPTVAGYYQLNANVVWNGNATDTSIAIYKNGNLFKQGTYPDYGYSENVSAVVYANGTTDTFTVWAFTGSPQTALAGPEGTYFNGFLINSTATNYPATTPRGSFYSTVAQTITSTTAAQVITYNTIDTAVGGMALNAGSQIVLPVPGDYLVIFSAECYTTDSGDQTVDIWMRMNGSGYVANTNTRTYIPKTSGYIPAAVNFIVTSTAATDYIEFMMCGSQTANTGIGIVAASASNPARPLAPSIIVTVNKIG